MAASHKCRPLLTRHGVRRLRRPSWSRRWRRWPGGKVPRRPWPRSRSASRVPGNPLGQHLGWDLAAKTRVVPGRPHPSVLHQRKTGLHKVRVGARVESRESHHLVGARRLSSSKKFSNNTTWSRFAWLGSSMSWSTANRWASGCRSKVRCPYSSGSRVSHHSRGLSTLRAALLGVRNHHQPLVEGLVEKLSTVSGPRRIKPAFC
jgi:hypothetical protein